MIIERDFSRFVVFVQDSILNTLNKISDNKSRIIFAVTESGILKGVVTDGDLRRWLTATPEIDLRQPVSEMMNTDFSSARLDSDPETISDMLTGPTTAVPLLDDNFRVVAVAFKGAQNLFIDERELSEDKPAFIIAEIGNNHNGSMESALKLIDEAARAGADCAKFQMRDMEALYKNGGDENDAAADLGAQYTLDLLSRYQLTDDEMYRAFDYCREKGMIPLCTPWDLSSLEKLERYGMGGYKVASADFTNYELLDAIAATGKVMICSTGMSTEQEIQQGIKRLRMNGAAFILLHCNSTYPVAFKDIFLPYMKHLQKSGDCLVGYSGHERDIHIATAAVALGAKVIEKHFTLDKTLEGNDHKVSLLPDEFKTMVEAIRGIEDSMGQMSRRELTQGEMMNRENLAKSLIATVDIEEGQIISEEMVCVRSPGQGIQPNRKGELMGRRAMFSKKAGDFFFPSDLGEESARARDYKFSRPWGVPVRYHDLNKMRGMSNMDLLEIHLSYKDMELDYRDYLQEPLDLGLVIHAPELFAGDHTLDLCSQDEAYRDQSVREMQRVIDLTRELTPFFTRTTKTCIVTNVGGWTTTKHLPESSREELYGILKDSLSRLDTDGVELIPQTMPPFPWHFGGQSFHNLFMDADSIVDFCQSMDMRICLDISHTKLACTHFKWSLESFVKKVGPYTAHMHLADSKGVDGEGLQIQAGDIDWVAFWRAASQFAKDAMFIPEIWQGHKNDGEGAWRALDLLEKLCEQASRAD